VEKFDFQRTSGKESIVISLSQPVPVVAKGSPNYLTVELEGCLVAEAFKGRLGVDKLEHISYLTAEQREAGERKWVLLTIWWKRPLPFTVKSEGNKVILDFVVPATIPTTVKKNMISLDVQKADLRAVIRLLAEQGGKNIVLSPEVKGEVTLTMKNVPWETVLDTIIDINGLVRKESGGIITLMSLEKVKRDEAERRAAEENRIKAEEFLKEIQRKAEAEKGKTGRS